MKLVRERTENCTQTKFSNEKMIVNFKAKEILFEYLINYSFRNKHKNSIEI